jgi:hypothetical protein
VVSHESADQVVKAPQKPVPISVRVLADPPWYSTRPRTTPRMNEPATFTTSVP